MSAQLDALRAYVATRPAPSAPARPAAAGSASGAADAGAAGRVVVVGSGKGGAGTSVLAALVALSAAAMDRSVLLVDADEHVGPQRFLLGAPPAPTLADLRTGLDVEALLLPISATLTLLPGGPAAGGEGAPLEPAERRALLRRVAALFPRYDLVVVDGGSRLDAVAACVEAAGGAAAGVADAGNVGPRLLVVTAGDPIALAASYALVKAIGQRAPAVTAEVLANRLDAAGADLAFAQIDAAARDFLQRPLRLAGAVPEDACLDVALRAGMPLQDAASGSPAAVAIQPIAARLILPPTAGDRSGRPAAPAGARALPGLPPGAPARAALLAYSSGSAR